MKLTELLAAQLGFERDSLNQDMLRLWIEDFVLEYWPDKPQLSLSAQNDEWLDITDSCSTVEEVQQLYKLLTGKALLLDYSKGIPPRKEKTHGVSLVELGRIKASGLCSVKEGSDMEKFLSGMAQHRTDDGTTFTWEEKA